MSANGKGSGHAPAKGKHASTSLYVKSAGGLKLRDEKTRRLVRRMRIAMPWLEDADEPTARGWAQIEIMADMAHQVLRTIGIINGKGDPRRLLSEFRQLRQAQLAYARELGMTPAARMAIKATGANAPFDLPAEMVATVNEVGESRARDRAAKVRGRHSGPAHGAVICLRLRVHQAAAWRLSNRRCRSLQ
jgi:hypothetical protein